MLLKCNTPVTALVMPGPDQMGDQAHTPQEQHSRHEQGEHDDLEVPVEIQHHGPDDHRDHGAHDLHVKSPL